MQDKELDRVKAALLKELDVTLQCCCHQGLNDVMTDLRIHYASLKPDSSPDEVFSLFHQTGVLRTVSAAPMVRMCESLESLRSGTFGFCALCGKEIPVKHLEQNPTTKLCISCDKESQRLMGDPSHW